jgi:hypothetical protein
MVKLSMSDLPKSGPPCIAQSFVTASHEVLFEDVEATRCDVCAALIVAEDASSPDDRRYDVRGSGLLVWSRGEERRYQEPPLCAACAAAIGVSALQRWEIEEEEG